MIDDLYPIADDIRRLDCKECDEGKLTPVMIPPSFTKLRTNVFTSPLEERRKYLFINEIWAMAREHLSLADEIFFIGYSFPKTDIQMQSFISMALRNNDGLKKIWVVTNQKYGQEKVDFEDNYKEVLSSSTKKPIVRFYYDGFEEFINQSQQYR